MALKQVILSRKIADKEEALKAERIMERIKALAEMTALTGKDRRKPL